MQHYLVLYLPLTHFGQSFVFIFMFFGKRMVLETLLFELCHGDPSWFRRSSFQIWRDFFYKRSIFEVKKGFRSSQPKASVSRFKYPSNTVEIKLPSLMILSSAITVFSVYSQVFDPTVLLSKSVADVPLRSL